MHRASGSAGVSLIETLLAAAVLVTLTAMAVPVLLAGLDAQRAWVGASYMAARLRLARMEAVKRSAAVALRFDSDDDGIRFAVYVDGNANGVRTADIARGVDRQLGPAERLEDRFPGVTFGIAGGVTSIEGGAPVTPGDDPIRLGPTNILTFTAHGTATGGTLYLRSRRGRQFAVRILGATGRTRVLEFHVGARQWMAR